MINVNDSEIHYFNNKILFNNLENKPLVTLALFTYNHEKYIVKSIKGALSQNYSPLEIIISDDCSNDKTFEIIIDLIKNYNGLHKIICIKNLKNIGTYNHVLKVAHIANSELIVLSAGDDISFNNRVEVLAKYFYKSQALALGSYFYSIDSDDNIIGENIDLSISKAAQIVFGKSKIALKYEGSVLSAPGCTSAYNTNFLKSLQFSPDKLLIEDGTLNGIINLIGGVIQIIPQSLTYYRLHEDSFTVRNVQRKF